eukprot:TRINITY_DN10768_c0_g1_i1.p2 TRINITY_DN10768_c0_g1~~TRINITY_DN10768_c0_g1_i1.p2  ORF type:complete len:155 (-),score=15.98 TRINITY_DN10768_c0_g1_i1:145-609(-)
MCIRDSFESALAAKFEECKLKIENTSNSCRDTPVYVEQTYSKKSSKSRSSKYRGVSKNGNQWQAIIMVNNKKRYVGSYANEIQAARAYDLAAIQNHGDRAKTNYSYSVGELAKIKSDPPIIGRKQSCSLIRKRGSGNRSLMTDLHSLLGGQVKL